MKRIAAPMVGGLVFSTILTLIIIPVVYDIWRRIELRHMAPAEPPAETQPVVEEVINEVDGSPDLSRVSDPNHITPKDVNV